MCAAQFNQPTSKKTGCTFHSAYFFSKKMDMMPMATTVLDEEAKKRREDFMKQQDERDERMAQYLQTINSTNNNIVLAFFD